jgi:CPA2 family monovalent cation:H+ antiporter-2
VLVVLAVKSLLVAGLGRLFRLSWPATIETALLLGPGGEFAFVIIGAAGALALIEPPVASYALALTSLTMALTPLLALVARRLTAIRKPEPVPEVELSARPASGLRRAIVVGYGRVGKVVCALLKQHGVAYVATDADAHMVARDRRDGHEVYYGDASDPSFLKTCGLADATAVIITMSGRKAVDDIVTHVRAMRPDILIVSRARDAEHARHLYSVGATDAVPETIEASLQLSEAALVGLGVATGAAIASIHEKRDEFRHALQQAAQAAGREATRAVRAKSRAER